ncbi:hypothetical protein SASPL_144449 [Salvia splendens]|uniref:R13L1/DRL21-like LRR repeat region domain-containing protein n=1 Tax=Salvia splendens TaxID=180675 RepID=A0A8X8WFU4_SALSN|nr:hypothetical protein SASPL_144449 [Salvia splendens]
MEEAAAAAILQVLLQNLIEYSRDQVSLVRGFSNKAEELIENLDMIQKFLRDGFHLREDVLKKLEDVLKNRVGDKNGYKIEGLGSLNCLKGELRIDNLERVRNKEEAEIANLSNNPNLLKLNLGWMIGREGETTNYENVLEGLLPHSRLE